jgi:hypothetical protein
MSIARAELPGFNLSQDTLSTMTQQNPRDPKEPDSRRAAVVGLLVTIALVVIGLILVKVLGNAGRMQDCLMSGRTNCAPIDATNPQQ